MVPQFLQFGQHPQHDLSNHKLIVSQLIANSKIQPKLILLCYYLIKMIDNISFLACHQLNMDYSGQDLAKFDNIPSWQKCSALCDQRTTCQVWTWLDDSYYYAPGRHRCHLKWGNPSSAGLGGAISGSKGCKQVSNRSIGSCCVAVIHKVDFNWLQMLVGAVLTTSSLS